MSSERELVAAERRISKARAMRYKKSIIKGLTLSDIQEDLSAMMELCTEISYSVEDDEVLERALDGDQDEINEFKLAFFDLSSECEQMYEQLSEFTGGYGAFGITEDEFDCLFPAVGADGEYLGFDEYEQDYYSLDGFEIWNAIDAAAAKLKKHTKEEILQITSMSLIIFRQFMALKYRYDCLETSIAILREEQQDLIKMTKRISELYDKLQKEDHGSTMFIKTEMEMDRALLNVPSIYWLH